MNPVKRLALKLLSSPNINMQESYKRVRKFQELLLSSPGDRFRFMDQKIFSADKTHEIPIRIFQPKTKRSHELLLFVHGGGWVIGSNDTYTKDCIKMADETGRTVLSVDYLKAPEHPFPAGFEDCFRVADLIIHHLNLTGIEKADRLTLIGNSAGANLVAAVSLRLQHEGKLLPHKQILINPVTYWNHDERSPFQSVEENGYDYGLTAKKMQEYMQMYEPDETKRQTPYIAPLLASDVSGQPETLIITSEFDPLRDEGEAYGHLLLEAGNRVRIMRALDTVHDYIFGPISEPIVQKSYQLIEDFLEGRLKGSVLYGKAEGEKPYQMC